MTSTARLCTARNRRGEPCQVRALAGSSFCWFHDPDKAAERKEARARGGRARHGRTMATAGGSGPVDLATVADVVRVLERSLQDLFALENSISRARAVAYVGSVAVRALELSSLEERVAALERAMLEKG